jgi:hypothetical protein
MSVEGDHVTVYRWVQRFTPLFADAARPGGGLTAVGQRRGTWWKDAFEAWGGEADHG